MKMKKMFRVAVIMSLILCLNVNTSKAQHFARVVSNPNGTYTFHACTQSANNKIYAGASWYFMAITLTFSTGTPTYGMAFSPMKKTSSDVYIMGGGVKQWANAPFTTYRYGNWESGRGEVGTYYMGLRLDTVLTSCIATTEGDWNAN